MGDIPMDLTGKLLRPILLALSVFLLSACSQSERADVRLVEGPTKTVSSDGFVEITGMLKNTGSGQAFFVSVFFVIKDKEGKLLTSGTTSIEGSSAYNYYGYVSHSNLAPGENRPFTISTMIRDEHFGSFEYQISWEDRYGEVMSR